MIKLGIIGAGGNATGHARYYAKSDRTEVVAVADPATDRATALAERVGAKAVADYTEFLDDVDAVVISSPNFLHREHAVACAQAGKHILCEKPMGLNAEESNAIADAVKEAGVKSLVGFSVQFDRKIRTMLRYRDEGRLGEIVSVWSRRNHGKVGGRASWRADHRLSGGILYEINVHEIDWMMVVAAQAVESVYARFYVGSEQQTERANDRFWCILNMAGGAVASHEGSWDAPNAEYFAGVAGTEGGLISNRWGNELYFAELGEKEQPIEMDPPFDKRAHFIDCIKGSAEPVADTEWGRKVMDVAEAIVQSAITGQIVTV